MDNLTALFQGVLTLSWNGSLVILALLLLRLLLRRMPRKWSYLLWAVAGFRLLCPVSLSSALSIFNLLPDARAAGIAAQAAGSAVPSIGAALASAGETVSGVEHTVLPTLAAPAAGESGLSPLALLALVWLTGVLILLAWNGAQLWQLGRLTRTARQVEGSIFSSPEIPTPFSFGLFRPRIYLPAGLSPEQAPYVLAHERVHIRRGDLWWKGLSTGLCLLHWFNPLVWLAARRMEEDMEYSCDEAALQALGSGERGNYGRVLVELAAQAAPGPVLAFGAPKVRERLAHLFQSKRRGRAALALSLSVCLLAGLTCCTGASRGWVRPETGTQFSYALPQGTESLTVYAALSVEGADAPSDAANLVLFAQDSPERQGQAALEAVSGAGDLLTCRFQPEGQEGAYSVTLPGLALADSSGGWVIAEQAGLALDAATEVTASHFRGQDGTTYTVTFQLLPASRPAGQVCQELGLDPYVLSLWQSRVQYVGDNSAVGRLRDVILSQAFYQDATFELFTGAEPYGLAFHCTGSEGALEEGARTGECRRNAALALALIENANFFTQTVGEEDTQTYTLQEVEELLQIDGLKALSASPAGVQQLLDRLDGVLSQSAGD